jgi:hypothetical protein
MPEAVWFKLGSHGDVVQHGVIEFFGLGRWYVADGLEQSAVIESIHPFERGKFNSFEGSPWPALVDYLGLVKPVDGFCQSIVIAVTHAAGGGFNARLH